VRRARVIGGDEKRGVESRILNSEKGKAVIGYGG